jgi:hypothetical protein
MHHRARAHWPLWLRLPLPRAGYTAERCGIAASGEHWALNGKRYCVSRETDGVNLPTRTPLIDHDRTVIMQCVIVDGL